MYDAVCVCACVGGHGRLSTFSHTNFHPFPKSYVGTAFFTISIIQRLTISYNGHLPDLNQVEDNGPQQGLGLDRQTPTHKVGETIGLDSTRLGLFIRSMFDDTNTCMYRGEYVLTNSLYA